MKFCPHCAAPLEERIPTGEDRLRKVCPACSAIHYQNPVSVVGALVERDDEILLCRRSIEPGHGLWTVPAGFLEIGEGTRDGARRETLEEAGADIEIIAPHTQLDLPHIGQMYSLFRARLRSPEIAAGEESLEVAFVSLPEIPWDELAFPVVHFALKMFIADRESDESNLHLGVLRFTGSGSRFDAKNYELDDHATVRLIG